MKWLISGEFFSGEFSNSQNLPIFAVLNRSPVQKELRKYSIDLLSLKDGEHTFEYELDDAFFSLFEYSPVSKGHFKGTVVLEKNERMVTLHFHFEGEMELTCDRSLDAYMQPTVVDRTQLLKYGEEFKELSDDMIQIPYDTQQINLAEYLYEFIVLEIPMKKLHPRFQNEDDEEEDELVYSAQAETEDISDEEKVDPRWEALKKLKKDSES